MSVLQSARTEIFVGHHHLCMYASVGGSSSHKSRLPLYTALTNPPTFPGHNSNSHAIFKSADFTRLDSNVDDGRSTGSHAYQQNQVLANYIKYLKTLKLWWRIYDSTFSVFFIPLVDSSVIHIINFGNQWTTIKKNLFTQFALAESIHKLYEWMECRLSHWSGHK